MTNAAIALVRRGERHALPLCAHAYACAFCVALCSTEA